MINMTKIVEKFLKKLDREQFTTAKGTPFGNSEDPKIFRKRKVKSCYCGWHSQGKETFNPEQSKHWKKNLKIYWRRLLKKYKYINRGRKIC